MSATGTTVNIIISGLSVSGNLATHKTKVLIDLGNSDKIGKIEFALQNKDGTYKAYLVSGNATVQADVIQNSVVTTVFRGTLETLQDEVDVKQGTQAHFTGYDYGQELLGLISPDARQQSALVSGGTISLTSGEQGMGSQNGMDLALYVSGVVSSGAAGYGLGVNSGTPATSLSAFMSQYFGRSGDTTGSSSGQSFSFKPYLSGMNISGVFPGSAYKTWYVQDGAPDSNANYVITFDTLKAKHEYAWDVIRKISRQGYALDRSGFKTQFEVYIDVSGGINMITSGTSNFLSNATLVYYQTGQSGANNNNIIDAVVPFDTTNIKNIIMGWFPIWTQYPFGDDYADLIAYSGGYWSGASLASSSSGKSLSLSGNFAAPGVPGFISIQGVISGAGAQALGTTGGLDLVFTLWSGYSLNILRWNVSGGNGVSLNWLGFGAQDSNGTATLGRSVMLIDTAGNSITKSGTPNGGAANRFFVQSGWQSFTEVIFTASGGFLSGTGQDGGWAVSGTGWSGGAIKQIVLGLNYQVGAVTAPSSAQLKVDNISFQFSFNYNPVVGFNSGSISAYGRRYEVFEFPYQTTDSGAASVVLTELQAKSTRRMIGTFTVKDNPNVNPAQLNITPGQIFVVDAPSLNTGSGQTFFYWRAIEVKHEWSHNGGFLTHIKGYPWSSGGVTASGQNLISYALPMQIPPPRVNQQMPITHWWGPFSKGG